MVTRWASGNQLGRKRFDIIAQCSETAVKNEVVPKHTPTTTAKPPEPEPQSTIINTNHEIQPTTDIPQKLSYAPPLEPPPRMSNVTGMKRSPNMRYVFSNPSRSGMAGKEQFYPDYNMASPQ